MAAETLLDDGRAFLARARYLNDNYVYLFGEGGDFALVDPGDARVALELCRARGAAPEHVLHTHGHGDHTGGSAEARAALGATVYGGAADAAWFAPDRDVGQGGPLRLGALALEVVPVPGHTPGSVLYLWRGRAFTGDTLFWGGCGNCRHGGDPGRLADTFLGPITRLPGELEVHPGHDYAEQNLPFALDLEPGNSAARARLEAARAAHAAGVEPPASTLAQEREANPFLRADRPELAAAVAARGEAASGAREVFLALRRLKDRW